MKVKNLILAILLLSLICRIQFCKAETIKERRGIWYHGIFGGLVPDNYTLARIKIWNDFKLYSDPRYNIHDVFVLVRNGSENVIYDTNISSLTNPFSFDVLALICHLAQEVNVSIHAWLDLRTSNPLWQTIDINGKYSDGGNLALPEYRNFVLSIINEIVENYPVKGIHLDYIRYSGITFSYDNYSVTTFENLYGFDPRTDPNNPLWIKWRKEQITYMVNQSYIIVKNHSLNLELSCAVVTPKDSANYFLQDWFTWTQIPIIDFACPMNYETDNAKFESNCKDTLKNADPRTPILMGIGIWQIDNQTILEQIYITRKYDFAGFVLFRDYWLTKVPPIPPKNGNYLNLLALFFPIIGVFAMLVLAIRMIKKEFPFHFRR
jgi:uncharacterized lipoprotein YddW (UPF0748 family)